ncbi:MAG: hypothetical protein KTR28_07905 [Micavibrio sp.]|nr:hypothetical protein [Micavibrio sp.]
MLSDFLTLELYFGYDQAALFFEDLSKHFTHRQITQALENGYIEARQIHLGPDAGRTLYALTPKGRMKHASTMSIV